MIETLTKFFRRATFAATAFAAYSIYLSVNPTIQAQTTPLSALETLAEIQESKVQTNKNASLTNQIAGIFNPEANKEKEPSLEEIAEKIDALRAQYFMQEAENRVLYIEPEILDDEISEVKTNSAPDIQISKKADIEKKTYVKPQKVTAKIQSKSKLRMPLVPNNNPGNIKYNGDKWLGCTGRNGPFLVFENTEYGLRAIAKNLQTYNKLHRINTIEETIQRWAPKKERNNTEEYIQYICKRTGYSRDQEIDLNNLDVLADLVYLIASFDSGKKFKREHAEEGLKLLYTKSSR